MTTSNKKPAAQLRLGNVKLAIWANTSDQGTFYSIQPSRTYKDDNGYHDTNSFSVDEILRLAYLVPKAVDQIASLRADDTNDEGGQ
jgi:hypothetical protein